jgi:hypothetical protein
MAVSMPFFNLGMSIALIWMASVWFLDFWCDVIVRKDPWFKFRVYAKRPFAWLLQSIFILHLLGLLYTENFGYGLHDLRVKVPLLFLPLALSGFPQISSLVLNRLLKVFVFATSVAAFFCLMVYWGWVDRPFQDVREITVIFMSKISHIRLSLFATLSIALAGYFVVKEGRSSWYWLLAIGVLLSLLVILQSVTGIAILLILAAVAAIWKVVSTSSKSLKIILLGTFVLGICCSSLYLLKCWKEYHFIAQTELAELESGLNQFSANGEPYVHLVENRQLENGFYVWRNIAWGELERCWNDRAVVEFSADDGRGQPIYGTLIRYMSSKGLKKDSLGVYALSENDIRQIEHGVPTIKASSANAMRRRIDKILFEIDVYRNGGNPSGNSVTQRLEFWRTALHVVKQNPVIGVGTGDVNDAMQASYTALNSGLIKESRLRAHNQYITLAVAFGLGGLAWIIIVLGYPIKLGYLRDFRFQAFYVVALLSFLSEDTLETQAGMSFFIYFICLFTLVYNPLNPEGDPEPLVREFPKNLPAK